MSSDEAKCLIDAFSIKSREVKWVDRRSHSRKAVSSDEAKCLIDAFSIKSREVKWVDRRSMKRAGP